MIEVYGEKFTITKDGDIFFTHSLHLDRFAYISVDGYGTSLHCSHPMYSQTIHGDLTIQVLAFMLSNLMEMCDKEWL